MSVRDVDLLIIGAGISGIGTAHHFRKQFPGKISAQTMDAGRAAEMKPAQLA